MTFSPLTDYSVFTSKYSVIPNRSVERLIIHHTAGGTDQGNVDLLAHGDREVSATYCLQTTGALVGIVPEEYRPWTSNSPGVDADRNAVTVETVNTTGAPQWAVANVQIEMLARLAADLCVRYGWGSLNRRNVIGHREVALTECPGPYLYPRLDSIINRANQIINGKGKPAMSKAFVFNSDRKTLQLLHAGKETAVTFREAHDVDEWGDRTIARGRGIVQPLVANVHVRGERGHGPGTRINFSMVIERGAGVARRLVAESRIELDTLGQGSVNLTYAGELMSGELVRVYAQVQAGKPPVTVHRFYGGGVTA